MTAFDGSELDGVADGAPGFIAPVDDPIDEATIHPSPRGPFVVRILGANVRPVGPHDFLKTFDVEAHDGRGMAEATDDPEQAFQFATAGAALQAWRSVPESRPTRPDGRPNRPLSAFTIEVLTIDQARQETKT